MRPALILVDLQNDFLHPDFLLGKTRADFTTTHPHLLSSLHSSVISFRRRQLPIIWIRSEYLATDNPLPPKHLTRPDGDKYLNVPLNGAHLAGSHYGSKQFCHPGSPGAEFHPDIQRLVRPNDTVITKTYYSGFTGTVLHQTLQTLNVDTLFFGGVTTTTCVRATVTDAFFHDYSINVIKSAVAPTSSTAGASALEVISAHYGSLIHHRDLDEALFNSALPTLYYVNGSIPSWRVQLLLAEKRIAYNPRRLRVMTNPKETRLPAFAAINPRCKTPTLVDSDGTIVIESIAILQYLDTYYPDPFMPRANDKAEYTKCIQRVQESENLHNVCEGLEYLFLEDHSAYEREIVESLEGTMRELKFWETYTRGHEYIAGGAFTIADCAFWPVLGYLEHRGLTLEGDEWVGLRAYAERINAKAGESEAKPFGWQTKGKVSLFHGAVQIQSRRNSTEQYS